MNLTKPKFKPLAAVECKHAKVHKVRLPHRLQVQGTEIFRCSECGKTFRRNLETVGV